ncbi:MAG: ABC transporter ATP-binding protein, partial [Pseudomonadota bacterium]
FSLETPVRPPGTLFGFIWHFTKPFLPLLILASATAGIVALIEVSLFTFLGRIVDWLAEADRNTFWDDHGTFLLILAAVVLIVLPVLKFFYETAIHQGVFGNFAMRTRWQTHRYVLRQSLAFFQDDFAGRISAKVMQTAVAVRDVILKICEVFLYVATYFLGAVIAFAATDWRLAVPMLVWLGGYLLAIRYFVPRLGKISEQQADARSIMMGRVVDSYTNISTVKMFAHAEREDAYAQDSMEGFMSAVYRQMRLVTLMTVALNTLNAALLASVTALSLYLWSSEAVSIGAIALTVGLVLRLQGMSHWIMWEVAGLFESIGVIQDGITTLSKRQTVLDAPDAKPLRVTEGKISFDDITFHYGKNEDSVIENLHLTIQPGEKVGLVGRSGAGKSTLVSLLLRFYDLEHGRVMIDGQDVSKIQQESLRANIGMVTQDTSLLHRSILDNIIYGRPDADRTDAINAAKRAQAHDFILTLKDQKGHTGYDAHVGERGVKLSGGQRQRIAIARVLLKNAPILILDEATSALDAESERLVQEALDRLMEQRTTIVIA